MRLLASICVLLLLTGPIQTDEPSKTTAARKTAIELRDAMLNADYAKVVDRTYDGVVKQLGGREKAIEKVQGMMKSMADMGIKITAYEVGEPGEALSEGGYNFVVVPTVMEMKFPGTKVVHKTYLLGLSSDNGKTWKLVDGAKLEDKEARAILPKFPAKLKLPPKEKPNVIKDR
jgi:hypothetical protein